MSDRPLQDERRWKDNLIGVSGAGAIEEVRERIEALESSLDQALAERDRWRECAEGLAEAVRNATGSIDPQADSNALSRYEALRDG